jgi:hypothetical protein
LECNEGFLNTREFLWGLEMLQEKLFKRIDSGWGTMDGNDKSRDQSHILITKAQHDIRIEY